MDMTHPDILKMERFGTLEPEEEEEKIVGKCACCGEDVFDDCVHVRECIPGDKFFCSKECVYEYFNLEEMV